ncbi:hypothetical protein INR49_027796 [Caranx melampygus]|nr:hypothetical protein INR49_027796 [Caranx melampygus]
MVSADVARSDMSRLINFKFIACFKPPSVTAGASLDSQCHLHTNILINGSDVSTACSWGGGVVVVVSVGAGEGRREGGRWSRGA